MSSSSSEVVEGGSKNLEIFGCFLLLALRLRFLSCREARFFSLFRSFPIVRPYRTLKVKSRSEILPGVTRVAEGHFGEVKSAGWGPALRIFLENRGAEFSTSFRLEVQQLIPELRLFD